MPMVRLTADTKDTSRRRPISGCWRQSDTRTSLSLRPSRNVLKNLCACTGFICAKMHKQQPGLSWLSSSDLSHKNTRSKNVTPLSSDGVDAISVRAVT